MVCFTYLITDEMGLHARPAGTMVKKLKTLNVNVTVRCGKRSADGKKLFALMAMGVKCGEEVTVEVDGENEKALCDELRAFFEENY